MPYLLSKRDQFFRLFTGLKVYPEFIPDLLDLSEREKHSPSDFPVPYLLSKRDQFFRLFTGLKVYPELFLKQHKCFSVKPTSRFELNLIISKDMVSD